MRITEKLELQLFRDTKEKIKTLSNDEIIKIKKILKIKKGTKNCKKSYT